MKYLYFRRSALGGGESHPYLLHQMLAHKGRQEAVAIILALKYFAAGAELSWMVPLERHSKEAVQHCAARQVLCWLSHHCLPKTVAVWCVLSSKYPNVAVLAQLLSAGESRA